MVNFCCKLKYLTVAMRLSIYSRDDILVSTFHLAKTLPKMLLMQELLASKALQSYKSAKLAAPRWNCGALIA